MGAKYSKKRHKPRISKSQIPWLLRGAIRSNNVGTLQYLFSYPNGVDPSMVIDGVCPLNLAVELGYLQMVKILIKAGAYIYVADAPRYPLHQASLYGRGPIAELLIRSGASVSALTERRQSCLHLLAHQSAQRFIETASILLKYQINPNSLDDDGLAPLHRASVEMVAVLVAHETTDVNICSRDGDTPLLTAAKDRRESFVSALIEADREFHDQHTPKLTTTTTEQTILDNNNNNNNNSQNDNGAQVRNCFSSKSFNTCITINSNKTDCHHLFPNLKSNKLLSDGHVNKTVSSNNNNNTPAAVVVAVDRLAHSIQLTKFNSTSFGSCNFFRTRKVENCQRCHSVGNPSDVAGWWQNCDRVQRILGKTVNTQSHTQSSQSPPQQSVNATVPAAATMDLDLITKPSLIHRARLDLDKSDKIGMTPLMVAAEAGSSGLNIAVSLINAGCNPSITDKVGMTALHHACYIGALCMVRYLVERCVQPVVVPSISSSSSVGLTNMGSNSVSLKPGLDHRRHHHFCQSGLLSSCNQVHNPELLNAQDKYGRTPIYLAACRGHSEVVNYLLCHSVNLHIPNKENKSPLYISAYFGYLEITNALLRHGAQVNQLDSHRKTPLYVATYHGRTEIVDLLLEAGANVNAADKNGKTPLYVAVLHGHLALARKLLDAGASVNRVDCEGLGPLHMAVKFPKLDIPMIKLLLNYGCDPVNLASFTRWLLVHGIIPEQCIKGDDELAQWLHWEECNVRSLKRICRGVIQRSLGYSDLLRTKASRLPLPEHLITYVSMKEL